MVHTILCVFVIEFLCLSTREKKIHDYEERQMRVLTKRYEQVNSSSQQESFIFYLIFGDFFGCYLEKEIRENQNSSFFS